MNYKQFLTVLLEKRGQKRMSVSDLLHDEEFLQKILDNDGVSVDDKLLPYFGDEAIGVDSDFYTPDEFSERFAGGGGIKMRTDLNTGEKFLSAGNNIRMGVTSIGGDERLRELWKSVHGSKDEFKKRALEMGIGAAEIKNFVKKALIDSRELRRTAKAMEAGRTTYKEEEEGGEEGILDLMRKIPSDTELRYLIREREQIGETPYNGGDFVVIKFDTSIQSEDHIEIPAGSYKCKVIDSDGRDINVKIVEGPLKGEEVAFVPDVLVIEKLEDYEEQE